MNHVRKAALVAALLYSAGCSSLASPTAVTASITMGDTVTTLADMIDPRRSLRLELVVIFLIAFEIVVTGYEIFARSGH